MSYDVARTLFYVFLILACLMFFLAVFLFFRFKIVKIIGDLSGANARKAIADIRNKNREYESINNSTKGWEDSYSQNLTGKITQSGRLEERNSGISALTMTQKIKTQNLMTESETTLLSDMSISEETTILEDVSATQVLQADMLCFERDAVIEDENIEQLLYFKVEYEIEFIHTDEEIALC